MIEVAINPLPDHRLAALDPIHSYPQVGIKAGETLGFLCLECLHLDEDTKEIIHQDDCPLAGNCKPTAYGPLADPGRPTAELDPEHPLERVVAAHAHGQHIPENTTLGFCCVECLCLDETAVEVVHERDCTLDGESGPISYADRQTGPLEVGEAVATDGGEE